MVKTENELIAYMDGYKDAVLEFIEIMHKHHLDNVSLCAYEMRMHIKKLNKAICKFNAIETENILGGNEDVRRKQ